MQFRIDSWGTYMLMQQRVVHRAPSSSSLGYGHFRQVAHIYLAELVILLPYDDVGFIMFHRGYRLDVYVPPDFEVIITPYWWWNYGLMWFAILFNDLIKEDFSYFIEAYS